MPNQTKSPGVARWKQFGLHLNVFCNEKHVVVNSIKRVMDQYYGWSIFGRPALEGQQETVDAMVNDLFKKMSEGHAP